MGQLSSSRHGWPVYLVLWWVGYPPFEETSKCMPNKNMKLVFVKWWCVDAFPHSGLLHPKPHQSHKTAGYAMLCQKDPKRTSSFKESKVPISPKSVFVLWGSEIFSHEPCWICAPLRSKLSPFVMGVLTVLRKRSISCWFIWEAWDMGAMLFAWIYHGNNNNNTNTRWILQYMLKVEYINVN